MKEALIVFNGIKFPHDLVDRAFSWAGENSGNLLALFLAGHETEESYAFPSDIDAAQKATDKNDADQSDMNIIDSHMKLMEDMAKAKNISCNTKILIEPALDDVLAQVGKKDIIFMETDNEENSIASIKNFDIDDFVERLPAHIQKVLS